MAKSGKKSPLPPNPGVRVLGLLDLRPDLLEKTDFLLSITDSGAVVLPVAELPGKVLRVYFADTEAPTMDEWARMYAGVRWALDVTSEKGLTPASRVVVQCHAGVSRSAAMAWAILVQMGYEPQEAFDILWRDRPWIWPNRTVLEIADAHLGLGGRLARLGHIVHGRIGEGRLQVSCFC